MVSEIEFHPIANIFPLIEGEEFKSLVDDIRQHGLREPIVLHNDGRILDGRNRYRACIAVGISPEIKQFNGTDAVAFVVSLNLRRRHLNESQRAMVASAIANLSQGRPTENKGANLPLSDHYDHKQITNSDAAEMLNVSERSVKAARTVRDHATSELIAKVERGQVSV